MSQIQLDGAVKGAPPITDEGPAGRPVIPTRLAGIGELLNSAPQLLERLSTLTERLTELADDRNQESLANILDNVEGLTGTLNRNGPQLEQALAEARIAAQQAGNAAEEIGKLAATTNNLLDTEGRPMVADLRRAVGSAERSIATLESAISDARPGLQAFSEPHHPRSECADPRFAAQRDDAVQRCRPARPAGGGRLAVPKPARL